MVEAPVYVPARLAVDATRVRTLALPFRGRRGVLVAAELHAVAHRDDGRAVDTLVADVLTAVSRRLSYRPSDLRTAVRHHVLWAWETMRFPLEQQFIFRRDVIALGVQQLPMRSEASLGRRRALLLRVAEELGTVERPLPPLYGSEPSAPYSEQQVAEMRVWAELQRPDRREQARRLLALGLGAGLSAGELCGVTWRDITDSGRVIMVGGRRPRVVRVGSEWSDVLRSAACGELDEFVFLPSIQLYTNKVPDFVRSTIGDQLRPVPQRMRATWLVARMSQGMPVQNLIYEAGVKSLAALARFERFLPAPSAAARSDSAGLP